MVEFDEQLKNRLLAFQHLLQLQPRHRALADNQFNWPAFGGKEELYKAKENAEAARQLFVWAGRTFDP